MSNRGLQTLGDGYPRITEPVHRNQSMWMNRLMKTGSSPSLHVQNQYLHHEESHGEYLDMEQGARFAKTSDPSSHTRLDINATPCNISEYSWRCQREGIVVASTVPRSAKAVEVVTEAQRVEITYKTLATNSRNLQIPRSELQPSMFKFTQNKENILGQKRLAISIEHESITPTDDISTHGNSMEPSNFHFLSKLLGVGSAPAETSLRLKEHLSQPESRLQCQKQLAKPFLSLDSNILPVPRDNLAGSCSSFVPNSQGASIEHINNASISRVGHDNHTYHNYSSVFVCDKKIDNYHSRNSENAYTLKRNGAVQLNDPSTSNFCFPTADGELGNRTREFVTSGHPLSHSRPSQRRKSEELHNGSHSISDVPQPVRQVGEWRLLSSSSSVEGPPRGSRFSQTNDHVSNQDVTKADHVLQASTLSPELKASSSRRRFTLLPGFDCQDRCREKLTPLGSPRNSEGEKDERTASLASKNDSSAETDIMDINVCPTWNSLPSITSSQSYKDMLRGRSPAKSDPPVSRANHLPDISQEPPAPAPLAESQQEPANMDVSTSRTESLDAEHLRFDSSSSPQQQQSLLIPSSRWVKRLKLSSPSRYYYAHGTKLGNQVDSMDLDKQPDSMGSSEGVNLAHPWIQRWRHNQAPQMKMELSGRGEGSKMEWSDYQTKQFPSIAALALMGKTMTGLQACKIQNKGSFVVWGKDGFSD